MCDSTLLEYDSMVTRSGAGGTLPPAVGVITDKVIAKRPDLKGMIGSTVRAPSKLDIASAEGSIRVWVDSKGMYLPWRYLL